MRTDARRGGSAGRVRLWLARINPWVLASTVARKVGTKKPGVLPGLRGGIGA